MFDDLKKAIVESIRLAGKVDGLGDKVTELSVQVREEAKEVRSELREIDKRVVRIEALIEFSGKSSPPPESTPPQIETQ